MQKTIKITAVIYFIFVLFTSCSNIFSNSKEVTVFNTYNQPVTITLYAADGNKVFEIPAYSDKTVKIKTNLETVKIFADGLYFSSYSETFYFTGSYCIAMLKANRGWIGVRNSSSSYIEPLKFYYNGDFNKIGAQRLGPDQKAFMPIFKTEPNYTIDIWKDGKLFSFTLKSPVYIGEISLFLVYNYTFKE